MSFSALLISDLRVTSSLGPVAIIGVISSVLAAMTFLPAMLVLPGSRSPAMFWPAKVARPSDGDTHVRNIDTHVRDIDSGWWGRTSLFAARN